MNPPTPIRPDISTPAAAPVPACVHPTPPGAPRPSTAAFPLCAARTRRQLLLVLAAGVVLPALLAACATAPASPQHDAEALLARARAYWDAVRRNDLISAWQFEELSLDPRWTLQAYLKRGGLVYKEAEVLELVRLEGDEALLRVRLKYDLPQVFLRNHEQVIEDAWVRRNGQWYKKYVPMAIFRQ